MTSAGQRLDEHLTQAITELSAGPPPMSGISRLANAAGNLAKQADAAADAAAADLEAAFGKQMDVAQKYKTFAADVKQKAADAENQLNQISNLPTLDGSTS